MHHSETVGVKGGGGWPSADTVRVHEGGHRVEIIFTINFYLTRAIYHPIIPCMVLIVSEYDIKPTTGMKKGMAS